ncbi:MAG: AMP-binding protein [Chlorobi bacterium]|nr:AMP-binding protein [Chlorobiota bacterium]
MTHNNPILVFLARIIFFTGRLLLSLRYRGELKGTDILKDKQHSALFLPNHQALVDPMLFISHIYRYASCVPVITSGYYDIPVIKHLFRLWGAIRVSDLEKGSRNTNVLNDIKNGVLNGLKLKKNIVLYPAGQLPSQGYEKIYNKQSAYFIVKELPDDVKVIGVRIRGLWGSIWSKAWTGDSPDFFKVLLKCTGCILANLIFFTPKRKVTIEFVDITAEAKKKARSDRQTFNRYLESFYNIYGEEKPLFLKHIFWMPELKRNLPENIKGAESALKGNNNNDTPIPSSVIDDVKSIVAEILEKDKDNINLDDSLFLDLGADSLNLVEIITAIEDKFPGYTTPEINTIKTVRDLCLIATGRFGEQTKLKPSFLHTPVATIKRLMVDNEKNILWQFLDTFTKDKNDPFVYDSMLGTTNKNDFLIRAIAVSGIIKRNVKDKHVGIMLPALQSTTLLVIASYMAGKIPVMLNWTVGKKILEHNIDTASVRKILTAGSFIEKISDQLPEGITEKLIFIEKEISAIKPIHKIKALVISYAPKLFIKHKKTDETAVILFTSGSETMPKAVPLTHTNIINDLWGVLTMIEADNNKIFLGILPPFHSFGFTVITILPLLTGIKTAYSPNPTDGKEVLNILKHTGCNILVVTPGFLKLMMAHAAPFHFSTVDFIISGAESLTKNTLEQFHKLAPEATVLEGYGITECAPVLTLNPRERQKPGSVGKFLPGIEGLIVDIDTNSPLPYGKEGMILVRGKNVFKGYLNSNLNPFVELNGKKYYRTGDLGYIDNEGFLFITGRLKRFIKISGEMISLPYIEKILNEKYGNEEGNVLAVEGTDKTNPPQIVLFTTIDIDKKEAQEYLQKNGVAPIAKITDIVHIDEIPVLGSGKTDYKILKRMIEEQ